MSLALLGMSGGELVVVLVIFLVLFGAKRIPEFAKGLGKGIAEFKKASTEVTHELQNAAEAPVQPSQPVAAQPVSISPIAATSTAPASTGAASAPTAPKA
jgi:sec-independent protein translocase protein TatA